MQTPLRVVSVLLEVIDYPEADSDMEIIADTDEEAEKTEDDA